MSKILAILPEDFKYFRSAWESTQKFERTLENLTSRLLAEETRKTSKEKDEAVAFKAQVKNSKDNRCYKCNKVGHIARYCRLSTPSNTNRQVKCFKCDGVGHYARNCTKSENTSHCKICRKNNHVEADCYFRKTTANTEQNTKVSFLTCCAEDKATNMWVVDSVVKPI